MKFNNIFHNPQQARQPPKGGAGDFRTGLSYLFDSQIWISSRLATSS
jgi:hypothetical protein